MSRDAMLPAAEICAGPGDHSRALVLASRDSVTLQD
jgi:hypothetical protein